MDSNRVPRGSLFKYQEVRLVLSENGMETKFEVWEEVWVKPPVEICTSKWKKGIITRINSKNIFKVNDISLHALHIREVEEDEDYDVETKVKTLCDIEDNHTTERTVNLSERDQTSNNEEQESNSDTEGQQVLGISRTSRRKKQTSFYIYY